MPARMKFSTFHALMALACTLGLTLLLVLLLVRQMHPVWVLFCYLGAINVVTFCYYAYDKSRAQASLSRVPEVVLHGLALAGGTVGAYAAMRAFRHKTIKGSFRILFWTIAVLQVLLVAALIYRFAL